MTEINIPRSELTKNSFGGTELMAMRLYSSFPEEYMKQFQIISTRLNEPLDPTKIRIAWIHDLAGDPSLDYLKNDGWSKFHVIVFVSNWQMQTFISAYNIPWEKCLVIENAITPFDSDVLSKKTNETINLIYTPTPHRGLEILVPVFEQLSKEFDNLHLDVYSSFKLYGWGERDKDYQALFDKCEEIPNITYHGSKSNAEVRKALEKAHIFVYPSIWSETSSLCLIEAMSAGLLCVHSNLAALFETAAKFTYMYQFASDKNRHANTFYNVLKIAINNIKNDVENSRNRLTHQKFYIDQMHDWNLKKLQWKSVMDSLLPLPREIEDRSNMFIYKR